MEITKFKLEDKEELLKLDEECFLEDYWEMEIWDSIFSDLERNIIYLAKENNEIVSYLMIFNWGNERNYVKITNIGTKERFRGRGIAHKLFEVMIKEMRGLGMNEFIGETRITNYPMQKVFNDFKFKSLEIVESYYENPTEEAIRYVLK